MKVLFMLLLLCATFFTIKGQGVYKLQGAKIHITGTSTLHNWLAEIKKTTGKVSIAEGEGGLKLQDVFIEIDANSIKSEKGSVMENNIYSALNTKKYPSITFQLSKVNSFTITGNEISASVRGNLTVAGTSKATDLTVKGKMKGNGEIEFTGSKKLKMTDFNIKPPTFMFGAMKTGDEVEISFTVSFKN
ncbi:MAG TPA: YceI family protein [Chitinophagales bacterium]|nr:YceI family protein [Chitinophagales bacterium]